MAIGHSIHIGLVSVDPDHYNGWDGTLIACENDAHALQEIAMANGFVPKLFLTSQASRDNVIKAIQESADELNSGDILWISYSGHGGQIRDFSRDEDDGADETWALYDGELIDDELYFYWSKFDPGVRILVTSDSCHSGSMLRDMTSDSAALTENDLSYRFIPFDINYKTFLRNEAFYKEIISRLPPHTPDIGASVLLISGCQDHQKSLDGWEFGRFTEKMLDIWNNGKFDGDYQEFHQKIRRKMPRSQQPNFMAVGQPHDLFLSQKPFQISLE
jgi:hypothetical protein